MEKYDIGGSVHKLVLWDANYDREKTGQQSNKPVLWDANYDRENNDHTNALRPRHFKWCDFSTNVI